MARYLTLYLDVYNKQLLKSRNGPVLEKLPPLFYADQTNIQIYPLYPNDEGDLEEQYSEYDWTDYAIATSVGKADADEDTTPAAVTTSFNDISAGKSGSLNLNTAGVADLLGEKSSVQAYFEIRATPPGEPAEVVLQMPVELRGVVLDNEAIPAAERPNYILRSEAEAMFARREGLPGQTWSLTSPNGAYSLVIGIRDDRSIQMDIVDN